jgi:hypothetical protein
LPIARILIVEKLTMGRAIRAFTLTLACVPLLAGFAPVQAAGFHLTDGEFDPGEWLAPTVNKSFFPLVGNAGGAYLYVDQGFSQSSATNPH